MKMSRQCRFQGHRGNEILGAPLLLPCGHTLNSNSVLPCKPRGCSPSPTAGPWHFSARTIPRSWKCNFQDWRKNIGANPRKGGAGRDTSILRFSWRTCRFLDLPEFFVFFLFFLIVLLKCYKVPRWTGPTPSTESKIFFSWSLCSALIQPKNPQMSKSVGTSHGFL